MIPMTSLANQLKRERRVYLQETIVYLYEKCQMKWNNDHPGTFPMLLLVRHKTYKIVEDKGSLYVEKYSGFNEVQKSEVQRSHNAQLCIGLLCAWNGTSV